MLFAISSIDRRYKIKFLTFLKFCCPFNPEVVGTNPSRLPSSYFPIFLKKIIVFYFALPFLCLHLTLSCVNFMLPVAQYAKYGVNLMRRMDAKTIHYLLLYLVHHCVHNLSSL